MITFTIYVHFHNIFSFSSAFQILSDLLSQILKVHWLQLATSFFLLVLFPILTKYGEYKCFDASRL